MTKTTAKQEDLVTQFIAKIGSNTPLLAANVDGASSSIAHVGHTVRNEAGSIVYVDTPSARNGEVHW